MQVGYEWFVATNKSARPSRPSCMDIEQAG
jgi:hypothetical protein